MKYNIFGLIGHIWLPKTIIEYIYLSIYLSCALVCNMIVCVINNTWMSIAWLHSYVPHLLRMCISLRSFLHYALPPQHRVCSSTFSSLHAHNVSVVVWMDFCTLCGCCILLSPRPLFSLCHTSLVECVPLRHVCFPLLACGLYWVRALFGVLCIACSSHSLTTFVVWVALIVHLACSL